MTKTYTLAYVNASLLAVVPTGCDIHAAVAEEMARANIELDDYDVIEDCVLTNDPEDEADVLFRGSLKCGVITDEHGARWECAVRHAV